MIGEKSKKLVGKGGGGGCDGMFAISRHNRCTDDAVKCNHQSLFHGNDYKSD